MWSAEGGLNGRLVPTPRACAKMNVSSERKRNCENTSVSMRAARAVVEAAAPHVPVSNQTILPRSRHDSNQSVLY